MHGTPVSQITLLHFTSTSYFEVLPGVLKFDVPIASIS